MSHYANYIREREDKGIIENEKGFVTYKIFDNGEIYLQDIYVAPEYRTSGVATELADKVVEIGREHGSKLLVGSVCVDDLNATRNMKVFLAYGMQIYKNVGIMIFLKKDIGEE